jgi:hypothetical protein
MISKQQQLFVYRFDRLSDAKISNFLLSAYGG